MASPIKIGLHSPFVGSTIGGGEKYLLVAAEAIRDAFPEHSLAIVSPVPVDRALYHRMLNVDLEGIAVTPNGRDAPSILRRLNKLASMRRLRNVALAFQAMRASRDFDLFITMVYVIPAVSRARRSVILCQFPYELGKRFGSRLWRRELKNFDSVVCYSRFVQGWVKTYWEREALVVNPPIDVPEAEPDWLNKQQRILSVGRFFAAGHNKRQDVMVRTFRDLCDQGLTGWQLHLAGSVHRDGPNAGYHESVVALAQGYPIHFHTDASADEIATLYRTASIYWHAAGFGADSESRPIDLEHFGMTTAEAMSHGAVPVVIDAGGQPEVVAHGENGYLWRSLDELRQHTLELVRSPERRRELGAAARESTRRLDRPRFKREIIAALEPIVRDLESRSH